MILKSKTYLTFARLLEETNIDNCIDTKEIKKSKSDYESLSPESDLQFQETHCLFCCNILLIIC